MHQCARLKLGLGQSQLDNPNPITQHLDCPKYTLPFFTTNVRQRQFLREATLTNLKLPRSETDRTICWKTELTQIKPIVCVSKTFLEESRIGFLGTTQQEIEALVIIQDALKFVNISTDKCMYEPNKANLDPPTRGFPAAAYSCVFDEAREQNWTLRQGQARGTFRQKNFARRNEPGRRIFPSPFQIFEPNEPSYGKVCIQLDLGQTYLCTHWDQAVKNFQSTTLFQWLEFIIEMKNGPHKDQLQIYTGQCSNPETHCTSDEYRFRTIVQGKHGKWHRQKMSWRDLMENEDFLHCPDLVYPSPLHSGCNPDNFPRYDFIFHSNEEGYLHFPPETQTERAARPTHNKNDTCFWIDPEVFFPLNYDDGRHCCVNVNLSDFDKINREVLESLTDG